MRNLHPRDGWGRYCIGPLEIDLFSWHPGSPDGWEPLGAAQGQPCDGWEPLGVAQGQPCAMLKVYGPCVYAPTYTPPKVYKKSFLRHESCGSTTLQIRGRLIYLISDILNS